MISSAVVIYVDVDDTLVRSFGTKRIPMPNVVRKVRELYQQGVALYCWSSGGADYARQSATELGIGDCFQAFLPKPQILLDDQAVAEWRDFAQVHPSNYSTIVVEADREEHGQKTNSSLDKST